MYMYTQLDLVAWCWTELVEKQPSWCKVVLKLPFYNPGYPESSNPTAWLLGGLVMDGFVWGSSLLPKWNVFVKYFFL